MPDLIWSARGGYSSSAHEGYDVYTSGTGFTFELALEDASWLHSEQDADEEDAGEEFTMLTEILLGPPCVPLLFLHSQC